jgi:hypothetical protein
MRLRVPLWSDYGVPAQKQHYMSFPQRGRVSSGPKVLVAAVLIVAGVIGIRGIYRHVIDPEWAQYSSHRRAKMSLPIPTTRRSSIVAAIPVSPLRAVAIGEATDSPSAAFEPTAVASVGPAGTVMLIAGAENPKAEAEVLPPRATAAVAARAERPKVVVKKKVAQVEHRRRSVARAYAQYGGRVWPSGSSPGFSTFDNFRRF